MVDYGTDVSTFPVTDMTGRTITGPRVVAEAMLRRYTTPNGFLEYDREFGYDLRQLVGADLDDADLRQHEVGATREALKDERVADATASFELDVANERLKVRVSGELSDGEPFTFVLAIGAVTSEVLSVS